jgi:hypothetical protein
VAGVADDPQVADRELDRAGARMSNPAKVYLEEIRRRNLNPDDFSGRQRLLVELAHSDPSVTTFQGIADRCDATRERAHQLCRQVLGLTPWGSGL